MTQIVLTFRLLPLPIALLLLAALLAAAWAIYRRETRLVRGGARRILVALRLALVGTLAILIADPVHERHETFVEPGEVLVVVDASQSFAIADRERPVAQIARELLAIDAVSPEVASGLRALAAGDAAGGVAPPVAAALDAARAASRRDLALRALASGWLEELARRHRLTLLGLAGELSVAGGNRIHELPPAVGRTSDLVEPLLGAVLRRGVDRVAGVILVTDGRHHGSSDPRAAARRLGALDVPLIAVGIGGDDPPRDVIVAGVDLAGSVFSGDEVIAEVVAESTFPAAVTSTLRIEEDETVLHEEVARLEPGSSRVPLRFRLEGEGRRRLRIRLLDVTGEARTDNNEQAVWLDVPRAQARVLLLDGGPRWEWRFLRSSWERDQHVDLSAHLVVPPPDRRLPDGFPRTRDALFAHDAIVLGDVEPAVFAREERQLLEEFVVRRGGTLILVAGERAMPYAWRDTPLAEILPVRLLDPEPDVALQRERGRGGWPLALAPDGVASGLSRLVPGRDRNLRLWEVLPAPHWVAPLAGVREGAEVLVHVAPAAAARLPGLAPGALLAQPAAEVVRRRAPVLAVRAHGAGRILFLATDATWRWRFQLGDELYQRFWGQVARWAMQGELTAGDDLLRFGTAPALVSAPGEIRLEALARRADGGPREDAVLHAVVRRTGGRESLRVPLELTPQSGGRYRARIPVTESGAIAGLPSAGVAGGTLAEFEATLEDGDAQRDGAVDESALPRVRFAVAVEASPETRDLSRDAALLSELAALSGGVYLPLERFREAEGFLRHRDRTVERTREKSPWNVPLLLASFLFIVLGGEWWLRKRCDLV